MKHNYYLIGKFLVYMHSLFSLSWSPGKVECLEWILSHGGSVTDKDDLGGTALHDAAEQGQVSQ